MGDVRELFTGKPIEPTDTDVDRILSQIVEARITPGNTFAKAGRCFMIYDYLDENGDIQYGEFNSGMLSSEMLWMMEKRKMELLGN